MTDFATVEQVLLSFATKKQCEHVDNLLGAIGGETREDVLDALETRLLHQIRPLAAQSVLGGQSPNDAEEPLHSMRTLLERIRSARGIR